jgi:choline dehydrogenase-like flavoprotein
MRTLDCDVLVIGSGAGGGVIAATLAERTAARVVLVERGGYFRGAAFNQREWDMTSLLYAEQGLRSTEDGAIPVLGGQCVGGGTTVNVMFCIDPVERVWQGWRRDFGLTGFSFSATASDYGIDGLNLRSCIAEVRQRIGVRTATPQDVNDNNRVFEEGCGRLGISSKSFDLNIRDCVGCGYCAEGCAYDAKQGTMLTYIADAIARGVQLVHHCRIDHIETTGRGDLRRATGAIGHIDPTHPRSRPNSVEPGPIRFTAKLVIVCAGAVESPCLLQRSQLADPHGRIGRGMVLHPSLPILGIHPGSLSNYRGLPGTKYSDHFLESHGFYLETLFVQPAHGALMLPGLGVEHFDLFRKLRQFSGFGVLLVDSVSEQNHVRWDRKTSQPEIVYHLPAADRDRMRFGAERGVELMLASGAKEALLASEESLGPLPSARFTSAADARHCQHLQFTRHLTTLTSGHVQATVKMSEDPRLGVVNSRGETHHLRNLMVCDSSVFPTSCGANPMISILSMARYQGKRIAAEASRYAI